jgi:hypothetical protein
MKTRLLPGHFFFREANAIHLLARDTSHRSRMPNVNLAVIKRARYNLSVDS